MMDEELKKELTDYEIQLIGKNPRVIKNDPYWVYNNHITSHQYKKWEEYCLKRIKEKLNCDQKEAEKEFLWFSMSNALKVKDEEENEVKEE